MPKTHKNSKRSGRGRRSAALPRVSTPPSSQRILCTYAAQFAIAESAAGTGAQNFFRLNSPYDPDSTGAGVVAVGYNTWSALFLNYKVRRVTVRVQGTVTGLSTGAFANVTMAPVASQPVIPTNKQAWRIIPGAAVRSVAVNAAGGVNMVGITRSFDNHKVARVTKQQYENDMDFSGTVGSNPSRQNYLLVAVDSVGSSSVATFTFNIQITYEVQWFNPTPMQ